uniref:Manganese/iron superoxide dismutase C-terminal domain-containing protein n=1 Tax=Trypanosoma congolense (strain IL3000) TaxID=1068625 RepID=G0ULG9_TRYCI|nr:conserved hypothetical protein [Trypanosoma congolense IL3000]
MCFVAHSLPLIPLLIICPLHLLIIVLPIRTLKYSPSQSGVLVTEGGFGGVALAPEPVAMLRTRLTLQHCSVELKKLLPVLLPLLDPPLSTGVAVSAAHVIVATGHTSRRRELHQPNCPVLARLLPLSEVSNDDAFLRRPCLPCLSHRAHFLASEDFCHSLVKRCTRRVACPVPAEWKGIVSRQFASEAALEAELVFRAANRREAGWTWLVYDNQRPEEQRLVVVNMPGNRTPLLLGLWPLGVVDMTDKAVVAAARTALNTISAPLAPPWSRAARNPSCSATTSLVGNGCIQRLSTVREKVAREAVLQMDWDFILQQWKEAEVYYASNSRTEKIRTERARKEREVAVNALSKLRDSGTTILMSDTVEVTATTEGSMAASSKPQERVQGEPRSVEGSNDNTTEPDPKCTQLPDGTWQYLYRNGDVTFLKPDGTRIFRKSNLTTTAYIDGSTLYEYPNNTSILDRADGIRITTFADGTKKEERPQ